jgi:diadenylate cyclase
MVPDPTIPTEESGTRHRTAQRVAVQSGYPVISVSQSMRIISLYLGPRRYVLEPSAELLSRANQAIATLERYKSRLDEVSNTLSALEIEDLATVRDAAVVTQRLEMVRRIADEITGYVVELGTDGRLLALQLDELMAGVENDRELIVRDYLPTFRRSRSARAALDELSELPSNDLLDAGVVARTMGFGSTAEVLDNAASPRGYRLLARVPRLPGAILERVVDHFGTLQKLLAATAEDLQAVDGVGEARARTVREAISRMADASIIDRYP